METAPTHENRRHVVPSARSLAEHGSSSRVRHPPQSRQVLSLGQRAFQDLRRNVMNEPNEVFLLKC
jgi:hypothetical protein